MKLYVAYGSNLNKEQMKWRCPDSIALGSCHIKDFDLKFNYFATIEKNKGNVCPAGLWLVSNNDIKQLDRYESVSAGLYKRIYVKVSFKNKLFTVLTYQINKCSKNPSKTFEGYYRICYQGYKDFDLYMPYLKDKAREYIGKDVIL